MAYVRSEDSIAVGCASTALAATVYDDFMTTHALFGIPVLEEDEYENVQDIEIDVSPERRQLLTAASLIVWDEAFSNHSSCLTVVLKHFFDNSKCNDYPKVLLLVGDNKQIAPVVKFGTKNQIIDASIISHSFFSRFHITRFTTNLRLRCEIPEQLDAFRNYSSMLLEIGTGSYSSFVWSLSAIDPHSAEQKVKIMGLRATCNIDTALQFLHSGRHVDDEYFHTRCILAGNNY